jgi:hypothetical protein
MAPQLAMVLPALSSLGYKPRAEVCRTLVAQVGRLQQTLLSAASPFSDAVSIIISPFLPMQVA